MRKIFLNMIKQNIYLIKIISLGIAIYSFSLFVFMRQGISPILILRDLAQTCENDIGVGFISNLGVILWIGISFILIFLLKTGLTKKTEFHNLILSGAIFSSILAIDDFFLIHDKYIIQEIIFSIYLIFAIFIIKKYKKQIIKIDIVLFLASYLMFGSSIFIDIIIQDLFPRFLLFTQVFEEGFKFIGIIVWVSFWLKSANMIIKKNNNT